MVESISSSSYAGNAAKSKGTAQNAADMQNQFLTLLVAQLQNQDPMNPVDNAQMTSQMAQISTVSGIEKLNSTVESVTSQFSMLEMMQSVDMIGRTVMTEGNSLSALGDNQYTAGFDLAGPAAYTTLHITTAAGALVETVNLGSADIGRNYFTWDGSGYNGDPSQLRFSVQASNGNSTVSSTALSPQRVVATSNEGGKAMLELGNGSSIAYSGVKAVY